MATMQDIADVIASALTEIGVTGSLDVSGQGTRIITDLGRRTEDDVLVAVDVGKLQPNPA